MVQTVLKIRCYALPLRFSASAQMKTAFRVIKGLDTAFAAGMPVLWHGESVVVAFLLLTILLGSYHFLFRRQRDSSSRVTVPSASS